MNQEQRISAAGAISGKSKAEMAREFGVTPQSFGQKMRRGTFSDEEMEKVAEIVGAKFEARFVFPDGTKI